MRNLATGCSVLSRELSLSDRLQTALNELEVEVDNFARVPGSQGKGRRPGFMKLVERVRGLRDKLKIEIDILYGSEHTAAFLLSSAIFALVVPFRIVDDKYDRLSGDQLKKYLSEPDVHTYASSALETVLELAEALSGDPIPVADFRAPIQRFRQKTLEAAEIESMRDDLVARYPKRVSSN
jgi:hypothetical protein